MSKLRFHLKASFRFFAAVLGVGLLAHLMLRTGPQTIWQQVHAVGLGVALIIVLGGISHVLKTWAWRLTFTCDIGALSWPRSFGMRLISEAIAQIGVAGKVLGEGVRVSLLGSAVPVANGISSGALDSGLHILTGAMITVSGIMTALLLAPATGKWRFWAVLFAGVLMAFVAFVGIAIGKGWRFASKAATSDWAGAPVSEVDQRERGSDRVSRRMSSYFPSRSTSRILGKPRAQFCSTRTCDPGSLHCS